jgi:DNA-directed RNA polymerase, mitochondrial
MGETIYFPHNLDFRGRAYPIPSHLNHIGNDLCRGLLKFKERKTIGAAGLRWIKIQVSNLAGNDKYLVTDLRASLDDREAFTNKHLEEVFDSSRNPIDGRQWWRKSDNPWQLLATCCELEAALKLDYPTTFKSNLHIHQDGSCNGLQHYAALGGDIEGAKAVNLVPSNIPGDVYTGASKGVQRRIDADAKLGNPEALLMKQRVNRKLVKQTVMVFYINVDKYIWRHLCRCQSSSYFAA